MTDIVKLGLALDPAPMQASARPVEAELKRVENAARGAAVAVDDVTDAGSLSPRAGGQRQGMGAVVRGARDASVGLTSFGGAAAEAGKKFDTLLKASVGFVAFDLGAKVLGFSSAMDVLNKATDAVAQSLRDIIGLTEIEEQLRREKEAAEATAKAWDALREARDAAAQAARGPGLQIPDLATSRHGGINYGGQFISTQGLSPSDIEQLAERARGLQPTFDAANAARASALFGERDPDAINRTLTEFDAQVRASVQEIVDLAASLRQARVAAEEDARFQQYQAGLMREIALNSSKATEETAAWMREAERLKQGFRTLAVGNGTGGNTPPFLLGTSNAGSAEYLEAIGQGGLNNPRFNNPDFRSPNQDDFRQQRLNDAERLEDEMRRLQEEGRRAAQVYKDLGQIGASAFESFLVGARSASDAVKALGADIYLYIVQGLITRPLGNAIAGSLQNAFPNFGANFAQHGATIYQPSMVIPMGGGRPTMIAEAGPERIEPAHARGSGRNSGGRGVTIVVQPREGDNSWRRSMRQVLHDVKRGGL